MRAFYSIVLPASIADVWSAVRDFGAVDWLAGMSEGRAPITGGTPDRVGCIRDLPVADKSIVKEQLTSLDDRNYSFSYIMTETTLPVANYYAVFRARSVLDDNSTYVEWEATFDAVGAPPEVVETVIRDGVFKASLQRLRLQLSKKE